MKDYIKKINDLIIEKKWTDKFVLAQGYCIICGHDDPLDIEYHHIAGRKNSSLVVSLCRICHGRISRKQQLSWPKEWLKKGNSDDVVQALMLRGISDLLRLKSDYMIYGGT
ncbi:MAG TPA: hypothetical protein VGR54_02850 [Nitrosopumilaceae archaeon]|nr:hypothetical protein [Nitrosopumilaceae archaeon]